MSGFHEITFPTRLAVGARGGPERKTEIVTLASGQEIRNAVWANSRRRWDIGGAIGNLSDLSELTSFFEARRGPLYGFRFRDPFDHLSAPVGGVVSPMDQIIGTGDGVSLSFQLSKSYGDVVRHITKPVSGTVRVAIDEVELLNGWSVDYTTGTVTFDAPPASSEIVAAGFTYDCPVRFDSDRLEGVVETFGAGRVVSVGLVELIGE
ncbi:MAG: DUF2460 domain-containing protein [Pseudomonadota bacterium]